jgi:4-hydroxythreonine-4-phosphate dehydrogenase
MERKKVKSNKPIIGITLGDFNGIGPETILKTLADNRISNICTPVVYGSSKILNKYRKLLNFEEHSYNLIKGAEYINPKKPNIINCWEDDLEIEPGKVTQEAGRCAFLSLENATNDLKDDLIDGIVTVPVNKNNVLSDKYKFKGHTEYLADKFGKDTMMILATEDIKVGLITVHIPVKNIAESLNPELIVKRIKAFENSLKTDFGISRPKIAILGLNPHAGDNGLIGEEEKTIIIPTIEKLRNDGKLVFGPYSADGFWGMHHYTKYDGVLAIYHDQGLAPFKAIAMEYGVNFTAGLPVVRTSPDHGTGYDIAGKGIANESSLRESIYMACDIIKNRNLVTNPNS